MLGTPRRTITDPAHQATASADARATWPPRRAGAAQQRRSAPTADGHVVAIRALPDYDALFGVDFDPRPDPDGAVTAESTAEGM